jgi:hypothetical protein
LNLAGTLAVKPLLDTLARANSKIGQQVTYPTLLESTGLEQQK